MRLYRALAASSCLALGVACGGGDLGLPEDQSPAEVMPVGGNGQTGLVGAELANPLVVRVVDAQGRPVPAVKVVFQLGSGADGGDVTPDTAETAGNGEASSRWMLGGTAGEQRVEAAVVDADLSATFTARAERSSGLVLELESGDEQTARPGEELPDPLVVRLVDEGGDGVAGRAVAWVVATGGGVASPESSDTDADGFATTRWTMGSQAGPNTLNAVVSGVGVVSFSATAEEDGGGGPSADRSTVAASPASIEAVTGLSTITVTVRDDAGAAVSGAIVTLSATGSGNILTQPSAPTGANGVATGTLQSAVPETKVVSAVVNGTVSIAATATVTVTLTLGPDHLVFLVQPSNTEENEEISPPVEVAIVDQLGGVVPLSDVEIEVELIRDEGQPSNELEGERSRETEDGIAVFDDLEVDRDDDGYRLRASAPEFPDLGSVESAPFNVED